MTETESLRCLRRTNHTIGPQRRDQPTETDSFILLSLENKNRALAHHGEQMELPRSPEQGARTQSLMTISNSSAQAYISITLEVLAKSLQTMPLRAGSNYWWRISIRNSDRAWAASCWNNTASAWKGGFGRFFPASKVPTQRIASTSSLRGGRSSGQPILQHFRNAGQALSFFVPAFQLNHNRIPKWMRRSQRLRGIAKRMERSSDWVDNFGICRLC